MSKPEIKKRLDRLFNEYRPDLSRSRIQAEIMNGKVIVNGHVCNKPGTMVESGSEIQLLESKNPYVSRGGLKIEGALKDLSIDVNDLVILDVGASTGGFSDCLLKKGAKLIYALDVGYGQLDLSLRSDSRIVVMERFNVRRLERKDLAVMPEFAVIDVSFISLSKILPIMANLQIPAVLALVKPQFEAGRTDVSKGGGVIRDPALHRQILNQIIYFACQAGYCCRGITFSEWPGPKGNIEYFVYYQYTEGSQCSCLAEYAAIVTQVVDQAHRLLVGKKIKPREG